MVDFPNSRDSVKGFVMRIVAEDGNGRGPGKLHVRPTPPAAWEGGWQGESEKNNVLRSWPCAITCEKLLDHCLEKGSADNLSAMLVIISDVEIGAGGHDGSTIDAVTQGRGLTPTEKWRPRRDLS